VLIRCSNSSKSETVCRSEEEIDIFMEDLQVDVWQLGEKIDFLKYGQKPVFKAAELVASELLNDPRVTIERLLLLRRHEIETEDDFISLGQQTYSGQFYRIGKDLQRK